MTSTSAPSDPRFVFWGYGSEDVLAPLRSHCQALGIDCVQLPTPELNAQAEKALLAERQFVLLTSSHFVRDRIALRAIYPQFTVNLSPLQIIAGCDPVASVFYPHDLGTPLVGLEPFLLSAFDLVLWPVDRFGYHAPPARWADVGWIGATSGRGRGVPRTTRETSRSRSATAAAERGPRRCWFFSDFGYHLDHFGLAATFAKLQPILSRGVALKLPLWHRSDECEAYFRERGVIVVPAGESTFGAIEECDLVVSNGLSGISLEAVWAGVPVVNLIEEYLPPNAQASFLAGVDGCRVVTYARAPAALADPPARPERRLRPFDFDHAVAAVRETIRDNVARRSRDRPGAPVLSVSGVQDMGQPR